MMVADKNQRIPDWGRLLFSQSSEKMPLLVYCWWLCVDCCGGVQKIYWRHRYTTLTLFNGAFLITSYSSTSYFSTFNDWLTDSLHVVPPRTRTNCFCRRRWWRWWWWWDLSRQLIHNRVCHYRKPPSIYSWETESPTQQPVQQWLMLFLL